MRLNKLQSTIHTWSMQCSSQQYQEIYEENNAFLSSMALLNLWGDQKNSQMCLTF